MKTVDDFDFTGKRVFIRVDFNVPLDKQRQVTDDLRIRAVLPTIRKVLGDGGKTVIASHLGRPKGKIAEEFSLQPVGEYLAKLLRQPVVTAPDCVGAEVDRLVSQLDTGGVLLLENLRFHAGEEKDDEAFAKRLAALTDIYVNDAFAVSHRAHASVHGITRFVDACAAGYQLAKEVEYYRRVMEKPQRPVAMIIGGAKVSTKIGVLANLIGKVDCLIIGGAMANTFLKAEGKNVGKSLVEDEHLLTARQFLEQADRGGIKVYLPTDAVVAAGLENPGEIRHVLIDNVPTDKQILDVGTGTLDAFKAVLRDCRTIVWNGPLGAFETPPFNRGTFAMAQFLADLQALTVIGGGDSAAAVNQAGVDHKVSYVSTGGGAFLEMLEGKKLPGIAALEECQQRRHG